MRILTLHRALESGGPGSAVTPSVVSASPAVLERHAAHLARRFTPVSLEQALDALERREELPPRAVALTVDDGYSDFAETIWPCLRRHGIPVTLFVPTAYPDRPARDFWWDRVHDVFRRSTARHQEVRGLGRLPLEDREERHRSYRTLVAHLKSTPHEEAMAIVEQLCATVEPPDTILSPVLSWDQLRTLESEGVTLAPHTRSHPALDQLGDAEIRAEVRGSIDDLTREIGTCPPIFSYPFGAHNDRVVRVVEEEGIRIAVTCIHGTNSIVDTPPLRLRRLHISQRTTPFVFRQRLGYLGSKLDAFRHELRSRQRRRASSSTTEYAS